jgi:replicative DNA helicase
MKKGILIVSLEMSNQQIIDRMVASGGDVPLRTLSEGVKTEGAMRGVYNAMVKLNEASLVIRDDLHDIASIVAAARAMAKSPEGLKALFVDYIQLIRCDLTSHKDITREREVAEVSRRLRLLGLELGCVVLAITQLNEQGRARESRAIGQDANAVIIVKLTEDSNEREISIPIQRSGPCGVSAKLGFSGRTAKFFSLSK